MAIYTDLDLTFRQHPATKDVTITTDQNAITKALKNLLLYNHYEKPFNPRYGTNINKLLFELMSPFTSSLLMTEIEFAIKNYEPRITLQSVNVIPYYDKNAYDVTIVYYIENFTQEFTANFLLSRLR